MLSNALLQRRSIYSSAVDQVSERIDRYSRTEIKYVSTINVKENQREVNKLSKDYRELDTKIHWI